MRRIWQYLPFRLQHNLKIFQIWLYSNRRIWKVEPYLIAMQPISSLLTFLEILNLVVFFSFVQFRAGFSFIFQLFLIQFTHYAINHSMTENCKHVIYIINLIECSTMNTIPAHIFDVYIIHVWLVILSWST